MKLVSLRTGEGHIHPGVLSADGREIVDVSAAGVVGGVRGILAGGADARAAVAAFVADAPSAARCAVDTVTLLSPIPDPGKIVCIGYNYRGHTQVEDPEFPDVFIKTNNTVNHPGAPVVLPPVSSAVDYESELAVVIGRRASAVSQDTALDYVGGYTVLNDVSARDWQDHGTQWGFAKCFDGFAPMGPAVVTPDEVGDVQDLTVTASVNGEETMRSSTRNMVFSVAFLVSYLSTVMTLEPGDVIATGTPQKKPEILARGNRWLAGGDVVSLTYERVGTLTNSFVSAHEAETSLSKGEL